MIQCADNATDRKIGEFWEKQFCAMAYERGKLFTPHQWKRENSAVAFIKPSGISKIYTLTLPDATVWNFPGEHHEIKHKNPTKTGSYGLELYRYKALYDFRAITGQPVYYTIHNHDLSGGRNSTENNIKHWVCAKIGDDINAENAFHAQGKSYISGQEKSGIIILYWRVDLFYPLEKIWNAA